MRNTIQIKHEQCQRMSHSPLFAPVNYCDVLGSGETCVGVRGPLHSNSRALDAAKAWAGVRIYLRKAEECQRPRVCMSESSSPAAAAAVAAPIRKLCPRRPDVSTPDAPKASRRCCMSLSLDKGEPFSCLFVCCL